MLKRKIRISEVRGRKGEDRVVSTVSNAVERPN